MTPENEISATGSPGWEIARAGSQRTQWNSDCTQCTVHHIAAVIRAARADIPAAMPVARGQEVRRL